MYGRGDGHSVGDLLAGHDAWMVPGKEDDGQGWMVGRRC